MSSAESVEGLARKLASIVLRQEDWRERLDGLCAALAAAAGRVRSARRMVAVVARAEAILRHVAVADAATIGRLYFDLLPRQPGHPLTEAVIAALSDRGAVLDMLRAAGMRPRLLKDGDGTTFLVIDGLDEAAALSDGMKAAIRAAMAADAPPPHGPLQVMH
ncbi:MAG: hypothetical protein NVV74_14880 [Magnetospirillum sp.]|nr:hypothetical protein [Magnetospirillum sp.]